MPSIVWTGARRRIMDAFIAKANGAAPGTRTRLTSDEIMACGQERVSAKLIDDGYLTTPRSGVNKGTYALTALGAQEAARLAELAARREQKAA